MRNPSVLGIISYKVFPAQMGGQKCVAEFYAHLSKLTQVTLVASKENEVNAADQLPIFPFIYSHTYGFANLRYIFRLIKLIKEKNIDIIIIEHSYFGWLGMLLRWFTKKPFIIRSHNIEAKRFRDMRKRWWPVYQVYEKLVHQKADHSFFITQEDKDWAFSNWQLNPQKCSVITYGTDIVSPLAEEERKYYRQELIRENGLSPNTRLFLFNGTLDYVPNADALRIIINEIIPLLQSSEIPFRIIICGNRLSKDWAKVLHSYPDIIYKGFVADINFYFKGADCMINPVTLGSGIRIKLVDALSYNLNCISSRSGAKGIPQEIAGDKLVLVEDYNWPVFATQMLAHSIQGNQDTPPGFYQMFNWDSIIQKALLSLQSL